MGTFAACNGSNARMAQAGSGEGEYSGVPSQTIWDLIEISTSPNPPGLPNAARHAMSFYHATITCVSNPIRLVIMSALLKVCAAEIRPKLTDLWVW